MVISTRYRPLTACASVIIAGSFLSAAVGQKDAVAPLPPGALAHLRIREWKRNGGVRAVAFTPDGKQVAATSSNGHMLLWQTATGKEVEFTKDLVGGAALAFSPDGKRIALAASGGVVPYQFPSGEPLPSWKWSNVSVNSLAFSTDGKHLVTGDDNHGVRVWDVAERKLRIRLDGHKGLVSAVAFAPDGKHVASASLDRTFRLWDVASGKEVRRFEGHHDQVWCLRFTADGKTIASASMDHTVRLWAAASGKELRAFRGHRFGVFAVDVAPDGRTLASVGLDGTLRLWETATGKELRCVSVSPSSVRAVALAPDGKSVATGDSDNCVRLWNPANGKELRSMEAGTHPPERGGLWSANWSPDDRFVVTAGSDGTVRLWESATGKELRILGRQSDEVWSAAFAPDGRRVVSVGRRDGTVHVWDAVNGGELEPLPPRHFGGVSRVAFSRDGERLATGGGSFDPTIHLWNPRTGRHVRALAGHTNFGNDLALSADGRALASISYDGTLRLWDTATGKERLLRRGSGGGDLPLDLSLALSPDGRLLAASNDRGIGLWDTASGRLRRTLVDAPGALVSLAFSPDGRTLAVGHRGTLRLWEMASGRVCAEFTGHQAGIQMAAFSSDGRRLVSASHDGSALIWDATGLAAQRPVRLREGELERLWKCLAAEDAAAAHRAVWRLSAAPAEAIPFLAARIRPAESVGSARIARWITELDDDRFAVRERASRELANVGDSAEAALRKTIAGTPSAEVRRRITALLRALDGDSPLERLREFRIVQALEYAATPAARRVLETLGKGAADARLTREAKAALDREEQRVNARPQP